MVFQLVGGITGHGMLGGDNARDSLQINPDGCR